ALTLGYKDALDPETKEVYSSCGAMHVLAVSGLHVGIIYLAINFLIGFLKRLKTGRYLFIIITITILWFYALLTGLSPSVLRSALMFSVLITGENLRRPVNIYNSLAVSAFILLFFNPNLIFETGFQLSYSAVAGIVFFQPKINNLFNPGNFVLKYSWSLFSVSLAAQLSTFPLTIYYFHQFPFYFWLSNFIVIPGAFLLIFLSIAIITTSPLPIISSLFANAISFILDSVYFFLERIKELPLAVIQYIHIDKIQFILLYSIIGFLVLFISKKKVKYLHMIIGSIIMVLSINIVHKYNCIRQNKIIIYNTGNTQFLHLIDARKNYIIYNDESQLENYDFKIAENTITLNHLGKPMLLKTDSIYSDNILYLNKPFLSFKNKNICFCVEETKIPDIEFDIVYSNRIFSQPEKLRSENIVTSGTYWKKESPQNVFCIKEKGAFVLNF
ncbi:MAG: ComEC/Rec2 family competence protein, partial [Prolixibacteraceae bacterium]|nr:ComEC/Rec2 family competence protein [Prolixibacteraceae bacterium]